MLCLKALSSLKRLKFGVNKHYLSTVLGIECTCDDTGAAIVNTNREILVESHINQWKIHRKAGKAPNSDPNAIGGIVPNLASKLHHQNLMLCVSECIEKFDAGWNGIDTIALSIKPGLEPCLWQGVHFTRLLLEKYKKQFIPVHHMEAHALTPRLFDKSLSYPYLALLISGGHTLIVLVEDAETFLRFGETKDIAIGNCIDKVAKKLGLFKRDDDNDEKRAQMSGGALIENYGKNGDAEKYGKQMLNGTIHYCGNYKDCSFTFSGLYTAVNVIFEKLKKNDQFNSNDIPDLCASFQAALAYQLANRLERALIYCNSVAKKPEINVVIAGGVASNKYIFEALNRLCSRYNSKLIVPPIKYCTDNGVMIAWDACEKINCNSKVIIKPNELTENFLDKLEPQAICELGIDISDKIHKEQIKFKSTNK